MIFHDFYFVWAFHGDLLLFFFPLLLLSCLFLKKKITLWFDFTGSALFCDLRPTWLTGYANRVGWVRLCPTGSCPLAR